MHALIDKNASLSKKYIKRKKVFSEMHKLRGKTVLNLLEAFLKHHDYQRSIRNTDESISEEIIGILDIDLHPQFISGK